jgi:hypothetical protein
MVAMQWLQNRAATSWFAGAMSSPFEAAIFFFDIPLAVLPVFDNRAKLPNLCHERK